MALTRSETMPRHNRHKNKSKQARRRNRGSSFDDGQPKKLPYFHPGSASERYYFNQHEPFAHGTFGDAFFAVRVLGWDLMVRCPCEQAWLASGPSLAPPWP